MNKGAGYSSIYYYLSFNNSQSAINLLKNSKASYHTETYIINYKKLANSLSFEKRKALLIKNAISSLHLRELCWENPYPNMKLSHQGILESYSNYLSKEYFEDLEDLKLHNISKPCVFRP